MQDEMARAHEALRATYKRREAELLSRGAGKGGGGVTEGFSGFAGWWTSAPSTPPPPGVASRVASRAQGLFRGGDSEGDHGAAATHRDGATAAQRRAAGGSGGGLPSTGEPSTGEPSTGEPSTGEPRPSSQGSASGSSSGGDGLLTLQLPAAATSASSARAASSSREGLGSHLASNVSSALAAWRSPAPTLGTAVAAGRHVGVRSHSGQWAQRVRARYGSIGGAMVDTADE